MVGIDPLWPPQREGFSSPPSPRRETVPHPGVIFRRAAGGQDGGHESRCAANHWLPLPRGEGWGEGPVDQRRTTAENESDETDPFFKGSRCRWPLTPALSPGRGSGQKQFIGRCYTVPGPAAPLVTRTPPCEPVAPPLQGREGGGPFRKGGGGAPLFPPCEGGPRGVSLALALRVCNP